MSEPLKLEQKDLLTIAAVLETFDASERTMSEMREAFDTQLIYQLSQRVHAFLLSEMGEQKFYLVTEQDTMRAQIAVKAMHDTLDLENRLAHSEYRLSQLEARNQQNSDRIRELERLLNIRPPVEEHP